MHYSKLLNDAETELSLVLYCRARAGVIHFTEVVDQFELELNFRLDHLAPAKEFERSQEPIFNQVLATVDF